MTACSRHGAPSGMRQSANQPCRPSPSACIHASTATFGEAALRVRAAELLRSPRDQHAHGNWHGFRYYLSLRELRYAQETPSNVCASVP